MDAQPYFSIVIPAYNREREIRRAIDSCLAQEFSGYEILVVDDGSRDGTAAAVEACKDSRMRLIRHTMNRGMNAARNSGIRASTGTWVLFLDSDDELLPGCLSRVAEVTSSAADNIDQFGFMYELDDQRRSPYPLPPDRVLDYVDWLRWIDRAVLSDALWAMRRRCLENCRMPDNYAQSFSFYLDFTKRFRWTVVAESWGRVHMDSARRLSASALSGNSGKGRQSLLDQIQDTDRMLLNHGGALKRYAPRKYAVALRNRAAFRILVGLRLPGIWAAIRCLSDNPASAKNWMTLVLALAGTRVTNSVYASRTPLLLPKQPPRESGYSNA